MYPGRLKSFSCFVIDYQIHFLLLLVLKYFKSHIRKLCPCCSGIPKEGFYIKSFMNDREMASSTRTIASRRPQDNNIKFKRHQIRVNIGPSSLLLPEGYTEKVLNTIDSLCDIKPRKVNTSELYQLSTAILVEKKPDFDAMMCDIQNCKVISVDYEFHTKDSFNGFVSIVSICTWDKVYILDPLYELWPKTISTFRTNCLENPSILKVFHNMDNDVLLGQTTFGAFMVGVVDLNHMYHIFKNEKTDECFQIMRSSYKDAALEKATGSKSLPKVDDETLFQAFISTDKIAYEKLVTSFYGKVTKLQKFLRMSDWRKRPLEGLLDYAAKDVYYLLGIFYILLNKLGENGLRRAMEMSTNELFKTAKIRRHEKIQNMPGYLSLTMEEQSVLTRIYLWRMNLCKRLDRNPNLLITNQKLVRLAVSGITTDSELLKFLFSLQEFSSELDKQKRIILAYLINDRAQIEKKENNICHGCNEVGHMGFECDNPSSKGRAAFMNRPENREQKQKQRERKNINYEKNVSKRQ